MNERAVSERARCEAERQSEMMRVEVLQREEAARIAAAQTDRDTERRRAAEQQVLGRFEAEARALVRAGREHNASQAAQSIDDEIDDWANSSPVPQSVVMSSGEERSGAKIAATEPSLANQMVKEGKAPALTPASGADATVVPTKRPKRGSAAAVVGD